MPLNACAACVRLQVGDWGRAGAAGQMEVARRMTQVADCLHPSFVVSTGDNFYPSGLSSSHDPLVEESLKQVYNATSLQVSCRVAVVPGVSMRSYPKQHRCYEQDCCYFLHPCELKRLPSRRARHCVCGL